MTSLLDALTLARFARSSSMAVIVRLFTCGGSRESAAVSEPTPACRNNNDISKIAPLTLPASSSPWAEDSPLVARLGRANPYLAPAPVGTSSSELSIASDGPRLVNACAPQVSNRPNRSEHPILRPEGEYSYLCFRRISAERGRGGEEIRRRWGRIGARGVRERHAWSRYDGFRRGRGRVVRSRGARRRRQGAQQSGGAQFLSSRSPSFALRLSVSRRRV